MSAKPHIASDKLLRLAAYQPDIAANLGAIYRICACFGAALDVIEPCGFGFSAKALRRSAMDYADLVTVTKHASWDQFRRTAQGRLILLSTKAEIGLWDFSFEPGDILMVGRESAGVPPEIAQQADMMLRIPLVPQARSLNVAVSAAIAVAEANRQFYLDK